MIYKNGKSLYLRTGFFVLFMQNIKDDERDNQSSKIEKIEKYNKYIDNMVDDMLEFIKMHHI